MLALLPLLPLDAPAGPYLDSLKANIFNTGQVLLFNDRFEGVQALYDGYIEVYPDDPAGYLFKAAALMGEMADREENLYPESFRSLIDSVERKVERQIDTCSGRTQAWFCLFRGHAKAYRSLWEARFGSFITAVKLGVDARADYTEGLRADSSLYDLYLGLGSYHYWKSARAGLLGFLRLLKNEKVRGISELRLAADSSLISREGARSALAWVWLDAKEYDSVIAAAGELAASYPEGKSFLWPLASAWFLSERYDQALQVYRTLRQRLAVLPGNCYNLIECDYHICRCLEKLRLKDEARQAALAVGEYYDDIPQDVRRRQRKKMVYLLRRARD